MRPARPCPPPDSIPHANARDHAPSRLNSTRSYQLGVSACDLLHAIACAQAITPEFDACAPPPLDVHSAALLIRAAATATAVDDDQPFTATSPTAAAAALPSQSASALQALQRRHARRALAWLAVRYAPIVA